MALVHAGERITPAGVPVRGGDGPVQLTVVNEYADGMEWLGQFVETKVLASSSRLASIQGGRASERLRSGRY
jgi:hypothetical protein